MTVYPAQIDSSLTLPAAIDNFTPVQGSIFNRLREAILAVEMELGIKPSGFSSTIRARLDSIESTFITLGGDIGGTSSNPLVIGIQGRPVSSAAPNSGDILIWTGASWTPHPSTVGPPGPPGSPGATGPAGVTGVPPTYNFTPVIASGAYSALPQDFVQVNSASGTSKIQFPNPIGNKNKVIVTKEIGDGLYKSQLIASAGTYLDGIPTGVLRGPKQVTQWVSDGVTGWISTTPADINYQIDFVRDCGADPTGTRDNGVAWTNAMNKLLLLTSNLLQSQQGSFTLYVPPGIYNFTDPTTIGTTFDFLAKAAMITIKGEPGASIFAYDATPAGSFGAYANMRFLTVYGMTFMGLRNDGGTTSELDGLWNVNAQYDVLFEKCLFANLCCQTLMIITQSRTKFLDCNFFNCASKNGSFGLIRGLNASSVVLERTSIDDSAAYLNGVAFSTNKVAVNISQIVVTGNCEYVGLIDSFIDEGCTSNIKVDGGSGRIGLLEIKGSIINPAVHLSSIAMVQAINCNHVLVDSYRQATISSSSPLFDLQGVTRADLMNMRPNGVPLAPAILADAACGEVRIVDTLAITPNQVNSKAIRTINEQNGLVSEYKRADTTFIPGSLLQLGPSGVQLATTRAPAGTIRGVAGATGITGAFIPMALIGQGGITMISDGAGPINRGDALKPSPTLPGRVTVDAARRNAVALAEAAVPSGVDLPLSTYWADASAGANPDWFNMLDYGPKPINPNDIGPNVQAAGDAALATGGGTVYIPPRSDSGISFWGWTTACSWTASRDKNFAIIGIKGSTIIQLPTSGGTTPITTGNMGNVEIANLIFLGDNGGAVNVPNVIGLVEHRLAQVHDCQFWGIRTNADEYGVVLIASDSAHVHDNFFVGCDYQAFSLGPYSGGVLALRGVTDFALIESNRFMFGADPFLGQTYTKSGSASNMWIWVGGQDLNTLDQSLGPMVIRNNHFEAFATAGAIGFIGPRTGGAGFVIRRGVVEQCSFGVNNPAVVADQCLNLDIIESNFGIGAAGTTVVKIKNSDKLFINRCTTSNGIKKIQFGGPTVGNLVDSGPAPLFVEIKECDPNITIDASVARPQTVIETFQDIRREWKNADTTFFPNTLLQLGPSGVRQATGSVPAGTIRGVAAATGLTGSYVPIALFGQGGITMLSDGLNNISKGDLLRPSDISPGRVTKATGPANAIALAEVAVGTAVDIPLIAYWTNANAGVSPGVTGPTGPQGATGPTGPAGAQGSTGPGANITFAGDLAGSTFATQWVNSISGQGGSAAMVSMIPQTLSWISKFGLGTASGTSGPVITQATSTTGTGADMYIIGQAAGGSGAAGGNVYITGGPRSGNSTLHGGIYFQLGGVTVAKVYDTSTGNTPFFKFQKSVQIDTGLNPSAPPSTSGQLNFPNTSSIVWRNQANSVDITALSVDSSNNVTLSSNGTANKTLIWGSPVEFGQKTVQFANNVGTATFQVAPAAGGTGIDLIIKAQDGVNAGSPNDPGGYVLLRGGQKVGTAIKGGVRLQLNADSETMLEVGEVQPNSRSVALVRGTQITTGDLPSGTSGDLIVYIGNCATAPQATGTGKAGSPKNGGIMFVASGALHFMGASGTLTVVGPA